MNIHHLLLDFMSVRNYSIIYYYCLETLITKGLYLLNYCCCFVLLQEVCVAHSAQGQSSNVATWVPLVCCHGTSITVGTQRGSLFYWGLDSRPTSKDSRHTNSHDHSHLPSYPQIPIPSVQVRTSSAFDE